MAGDAKPNVLMILVVRLDKDKQTVLDKASNVDGMLSRFMKGTALDLMTAISTGALDRRYKDIRKGKQSDPGAFELRKADFLPGIEQVQTIIQNYELLMSFGKPSSINGSTLASAIIAKSPPEPLNPEAPTDAEKDAIQAVRMPNQAAAASVVSQYQNAVPEEQWVKWFPSAGPLKAPGFDLDEYIKNIQVPEQMNAIAAIQKELQQTKAVLSDTISSLLERGEKIDTLVEKSDGLSAQSKMFYTQAKKQNGCCIVM